MRWRAHHYSVPIERELDVDQLARISESAAYEAEESGELAGNQMYQDLRGYGWAEVAAALEVEHRIIARLQAAEDLEAEAANVEDDRIESFEPVDSLWGLDVGVASATIALSALGGVPVGSCNAGGFGGLHQAAFPYVTFFVGHALPETLIAIARAANVGLRNAEGGLAQIFGAGDLDLLRFAETALKLRESPTPPFRP
jgi:hypothetical protein